MTVCAAAPVATPRHSIDDAAWDEWDARAGVERQRRRREDEADLHEWRAWFEEHSDDPDFFEDDGVEPEVGALPAPTSAATAPLPAPPRAGKF